MEDTTGEWMYQDIDLDTVMYFYAVQFPLTVTLQLRNRRQIFFETCQ